MIKVVEGTLKQTLLELASDRGRDVDGNILYLFRDGVSYSYYANTFTNTVKQVISDNGGEK